ncbi:hypothetical protein GGI07_005837, partial [Coemansia sp. Benny D115]
DRVLRGALREALVFLLREGVVTQMHTWPLVLVPNYVKHNLTEEQFVRLAFAWFRTLHTSHPDLLGAFPHALLDRAEMDCWRSDELREQADVALVYHASRDAESRVILCRVMRKVALRRMHDAWQIKKRGKHGHELHRLERDMAEEENRIHAFCNQLETERMESWMQTKAQHEAALAQSRKERLDARRAQGKDVAADVDPTVPLHRWYTFIKQDPDLAQLAREIVEKHVSWLPVSATMHRPDAESRFLERAVRSRPAQLRDWFAKHVHMFTGANHLAMLAEAEQVSVVRLEAMLREFHGVVLMPQHV